MDIVSGLTSGLIAAAAVAFVTYITHHQYKTLSKGLDDLRQDLMEDIAEIKQELRDFRTELRAELRSEVAAVRSDLTQVALAVGAQPRPQTG